jgi:hypothetical protein
MKVNSGICERKITKLKLHNTVAFVIKNSMRIPLCSILIFSLFQLQMKGKMYMYSVFINSSRGKLHTEIYKCNIRCSNFSLSTILFSPNFHLLQKFATITITTRKHIWQLFPLSPPSPMALQFVSCAFWNPWLI